MNEPHRAGPGPSGGNIHVLHLAGLDMLGGTPPLDVPASPQDSKERGLDRPRRGKDPTEWRTE
jgi:hypothetical protein